MTNFQKHREELLKCPEFKAEYERAVAELDIAYKLLETRENLNISQEELAERTGIRQSNISRLESGKNSPTVAMLHKIAKGLGATLRIEFDLSESHNVDTH
ncbi:MAG: helix-turn-helix transcriptional regulator [Firmicutes bacterium]|nr:helix-turn-helix transcriptional regulator [Bacillota bacterium]